MKYFSVQIHEIGFFKINNETLVFICNELPWYLLCTWLIYGITVVFFPNLSKKITNYYLVESIPSIFITLGLLGTFLGIAYGLINFDTDPNSIKESIKELLNGLKTAFYTSIFGIILSFIFKTIINIRLSTNFIAHPDDIIEQQLLNCINNNLQDIRNNSIRTVDALNDIANNKLRNISDGTNGLAQKLDKFFDDMAAKSANAIQEALTNVITDFNDTFKTFIGQLVEKNFDRLTESINQLIVWQQNYKTDITLIKEAYDRLAKNHSEFVKKTDDWVAKLDAIAGSSSQLQGIIDDFQSAFDNESRFSEVIGKINASANNLKDTSDAVNDHTKQLEKTTDALFATKEEITKWLNQEEGVRTMVTALGQSLRELREFEITQIEKLDESFINRLQNTFKGLDEIMSAQLELVLEKINKNESQN